jgi:hypothetical protein
MKQGDARVYRTGRISATCLSDTYMRLFSDGFERVSLSDANLVPYRYLQGSQVNARPQSDPRAHLVSCLQLGRSDELTIGCAAAEIRQF